MTALISGSMAFDTIMVFRDRFSNHILPEQVQILNVSFMVPELRKEFGGCAGNIAYNLKLLGEIGIPLATVGADFEPYAQWLDRKGIPTDHIKVVDDSYTAQAFITTDEADNQITAFHPGAMSEAHQVRVPTDAGGRVGIVAPNGRDGMVQHAEQFAAAGIPFIFDPGQGLPMFEGEELLRFVEQARWVAVNDYESRLLQDRTGLALEALAERVEALVVTLGGEGSRIHTGGRVLEIPAVKPAALVDPTGCGDAYRAGLLYGLLNGLDWEITGRVASLMGSIKIEQAGTQNHGFTRDGFRMRFQQEFGTEM
ncbi:carbohydrate kinase family protein [Alkalilimnicola sp. S0819]|uniref:carbohydrate kinase family protein n=1 Tax=Alkalilimnicola sp. S0819 TaxID=2613922 RepID=UPI001261E5EC|nr:carbohydrate kinase family protein [Alkalilimnicola sp. S0819]KAB7628213.1 carbohydrate kinase family protein [Alkalilimnicola sp. S0819]MPQ15104.1 carbohydrate kinase family protein [Alkalilimnicola sp. S0819]